MISAGIVSSVVSYKLKTIKKRKLVFRILFWSIIFIGLALAGPIYSWLFSNKLTQTEPLSLFDVIQITGIIFALYIANQAYTKINYLEHKVHEMHKEISIRLSKEQ
jgi:hypothetical protein